MQRKAYSLVLQWSNFLSLFYILYHHKVVSMAYLLICIKYVFLGWFDVCCYIKYLGYTKVNCLGFGSFNEGSFIIAFRRGSCIWGLCWILGVFQELVKFNPMTSFGCTGKQIPQVLGFYVEPLIMGHGIHNSDGHCLENGGLNITHL